MLQKIRDRLEGTIAKVLIGLITVPFALWGIDSFFTGSVPDAASVNGFEISENDLAQAIELQRRQVIARSGDKVDPSELEEAKLRGPVLDSLIDRALLRQVAESSGFRASDNMINSIIIADDSFEENGSFSQERFRNILGSVGMSPMYYRKMLGEEVLINEVLSGIGGSAFVTEADLAEVARITLQSLDLRYLTVPIGAVDGVEVPEARVREYFEANRDEFHTEETVAVDYLELKLEDLYEPIPDDELRREFATRMENFEGARERHAAHIMFSSLDDDAAKARLGEIRQKLVGGGDFAELARENSEDVGSATSGGDLGYSAGDAFPPEFEQALAALKPGEVSEPVRTDAGWHIVKLLDERTQDAPTFDQQRETIERELQKTRAEPRFAERSEQLANLTFNSEGLADAAKELGLELHRSAAFGRRGGEGIFADSRLISAAFAEDVLKEGQNSQVLELEPGHAVVLHLSEHAPAREQELAEVEDRVKELLVEAIRREQTAARAERLLAAIAEGSGIEQLAGEEKLEWQVVLEFKRGGVGVPPELASAVFASPRVPGQASRGTVTLGAGDVVVYQADNFRDGNIAQVPKDQLAQMRGVLAQSRGNSAVAYFRKQLRERADVVIN